MAQSRFGRWFFGEGRPEWSEVGDEPPRDGVVRPGWYQVDGTLRYHDGKQWTGHVAPPYPGSISGPAIALAVAAGVLVALFLVWLGAQVSPEHIYLPVKFVVKELPEALR